MWPDTVFVPLALLYDTQTHKARAATLALLTELGTQAAMQTGVKIVFFMHDDDFLSWVDDTYYTDLRQLHPAVRLSLWPSCLSRKNDPGQYALLDYDLDRVAVARERGVYAYTLPRSRTVSLTRALWCDALVSYVFFGARATPEALASRASGKCP